MVTPNLSIAREIETPMSTIHLYSACKEATKNDYARGFCDGAIDALYSSLENWCVPNNVTHGQVKAKIKEELLRNIPPISSKAFEFIKKVIGQEWPCQ